MAKQNTRLLQVLEQASERDHANVSDQELLRWFVEGRQDAFATLVRRYSRLVLGVCRQALSPSDAEDVCQATFLILARKAKSGRWQRSIANWLYTTARKLAHNARLAAQRRAKREQRAAVPETVSSVDTMTGRELLETLSEEIERLAPIYREPLVLSFLEDMSRDEIATRLDIPAGTVKTRLERGKKRLGEALAKRGVVGGLGLLAVAATSRTGVAGPRLIESIMVTVGGSPSPTVANLAQEFAVNGMLSKAKLTLFFMVGTLVLGFGFISIPPVAAERQKPNAKANSTESDDKTTNAKDEKPKAEVLEQTISGKVVNTDGKPVVAELFLIEIEGTAKSYGKTNADGTFKVTVPLKEPGAWLVANAPGYGIDFMFPASNTPAEVTFKLPKESLIRGRIVDPQGKAVSQATVSVTSVSVFENGSAERHFKVWAKEWRSRGIPFPDGDRAMWFRSRLTLQNLIKDTPLLVKSDNEGKFEIAGIGAETLISLTIRGVGFADTRAGVMNRTGFDPKPYNEAANDGAMRAMSFTNWQQQLHGPEPSIVVEQEKIIRGTVTDRDTGKPRVGVQVAFTRPNKRDLNPNYNAATTDQDGKYEIRGSRKHKGYMVEVDPDPQVGYLPAQAFAEDTAGYEPVTIDVKCAKGIIVTGTVKEKETGKAIVGYMHTSVLANNSYVKDYPPFLHSASGNARQNHTDKEGRYRLVVIPGPTLLMAGSNKFEDLERYQAVRPDPEHPECFTNKFGGLTYYGLDSSYGLVQGSWCKVLNLKPTDKEVTINIELALASKKPMHIIDQEGKPVLGAHATGSHHQEWHRPKEYKDTHVLTLLNLDTKAERPVAAAHLKQKLVGTQVVKESDKDPAVKLGVGGSVTGRLVNAEGKPLVGMRVDLHFKVRQVSEVWELMTYGQEVVTDAKGEFRFATLFPGQEFRLLFMKGTKRIGPDYGKAAKHTIAKHGDTLQLGDVKIDTNSTEGDE